ncbi:hypothetical protein ABIA31_000271 [Catenulispora sp. MAP5-51]|uniref:hypothetical protein n=1 Tax=Catenulispora sp. MAP5-51 TaxID=3156298 RepID=UPI00351534E2
MLPSDLGETRVDWLLAMGYGAIGGAVVEAVVSSDRVLAWNAARHQALARRGATPGPALTAYVDPLSDVAAGLTRVLLGAVAGLLFHSQVTGAYAAIAVGCSAPTVLRQLGSARLGSGFEIQAGLALSGGPEQGAATSAAPYASGSAAGPEPASEPEAEPAAEDAAVPPNTSPSTSPETPTKTPTVPQPAIAEEQA